jgi:predicted regulator of Ras-like GTPase activity (Roadblock/LC7/MglB family)
MSSVVDFIQEEALSVDQILGNLLEIEEVLGVLTVTVEGLVMGSAGLVETDIDLVSLLGASLVGVAERSTRRLGAGSALGMTIDTHDGMITVRNGGDFAMMVFSRQCDHRALQDALTEPMEQIARILNPE